MYKQKSLVEVLTAPEPLSQLPTCAPEGSLRTVLASFLQLQHQPRVPTSCPLLHVSRESCQELGRVQCFTFLARQPAGRPQLQGFWEKDQDPPTPSTARSPSLAGHQPPLSPRPPAPSALEVPRMDSVHAVAWHHSWGTLNLGCPTFL